MLAEIAHLWHRLDAMAMNIMCSYIGLSTECPVGTVTPVNVINGILELSKEKQQVLVILWNHLKQHSMTAAAVAGGESPVDPATAVAPQVFVDKSNAEPPLVAYKEEALAPVKKYRAHLFYNYAVLQYLTTKGAFVAFEHNKTTVDVNDSSNEWVLTADKIRIPAHAFGRVHTIDMVSDDMLTNQLSWTKYTLVTFALFGAIQDAKMTDLAVDLTAFGQSCMKGPCPGPLINYRFEMYLCPAQKTTLYVSPEMYDFVSECRVAGWTHLWESKTGVRLCMLKGFYAKICKADDKPMVYFPEDACRGKVFVLEDLIPDWSEQRLVTAEQVVEALKELGHSMRQSGATSTAVTDVNKSMRWI